MSIITQNAALQGLLAAHMPALAEYEGLTPEAITSAIEAGTMVLLGNPNHANVKPILVGQPSRVKVNANIGTSPFQNHPGCEMRKLEVAQEAGADTVMDLSIAGDLVAIRKDMLSRTPLPLGTVPLYSVAQRYIDKDRDPADIDPEELFAEVEMQAEQGVDFMTLALRPDPARGRMGPPAASARSASCRAAVRSSPAGCSRTTRKTRC